MANFFDYLDWRGDISFKAAPLNEVDSMILAWVSYVDFDDIVSSSFSDEGISISQVAEEFFKRYDLDEILADTGLFTRTSALLLKRCAECERYRDVKVLGFQKTTDDKIEVQFAAMTFLVDKKVNVVTYRGTDSSIVGWKEDCNLAYMDEIPAQKLAVEYLKEACSNVVGSVYVVGHSKGGNLAVYASCKAPKKIRDRVKEVYNLDGPGFENTDKLGEAYNDTMKKVRTFIPEFSMVGVLLETGKEAKVVKSDEKLINQHNLGSWQVRGTKAELCDKLSKESEILDISVKNWVRSLEPKQREEFIDAFFNLLQANDTHSTLEIGRDPLKYAAAVIKEFKALPKETRQMLTKVTGVLIKEGHIAIKKTINLSTPKVSNFLIDSKE